MLNNNPTLLRRLAGTSLAVAVAAGGLALSLPAAAEPGAKEVKTFRIVSDGKDGSTWKVTQDKPAAGEPVRKEVRVIEIHGADGARKEGEMRSMIDMERKCPGETVEVESAPARTDANKQEKSKIVICTAKGEPKAGAVKGLEEAVTRIQGNTDMDPAIKADLTAKLQAKIAELKARN